MTDTDALLSIGAFARRVGLAPSALRFYDDCGILRPAYVEDATGYRYYDPGQEPRATLVRRLRAAGVPLTDASMVLDGTYEEARAVLETHARRTRDTAAAAQAAIDDILRDLPGGVRGTRARIGGAELSSAVRQVAPAVAGPAVRTRFPVLGCVLIEVDGHEVRLAATDRYRLAVRTLPSAVDGDPRRILVGAEVLRDVAAWALPLPEVTIEIEDRSARVSGGGRVRALPASEETFPDYRVVLTGLPAARNRVIIDRNDLRRALVTAGRARPVVLRAEERQITVIGGDPPEATYRAICTGPPLRVAFDPDVLVAALDAGVGPDVLLEISSATEPVVIRSADQGSFTTLIMPVRDAGEDAGE